MFVVLMKSYVLEKCTSVGVGEVGHGGRRNNQSQCVAEDFCGLMWLVLERVLW